MRIVFNTVAPTTDQNATHRMTCVMLELAEMMGRFPAQTKRIDPRAWVQLTGYAPKPLDPAEAEQRL